MKRTLLALALLFVPAVAQAEGPPSRWERAKDPEKIEDYRLHVSAEKLFRVIALMRRGGRGELAERMTRDLVVSLDSWDSANSDDLRLRVDLGRALYDQSNYRRAREVLESAVKLNPNHPAVQEAWFTLGVACGHLGDHICERDAYQKTIDYETEDEGRMTPTLNLAEVEMHLGHLKESIALYQETYRLGARIGSNKTIILAEWGLAVAHDREGDRPAAERAAKRALEISASIQHDELHDPLVSFYPAYEIFYYEGLGAVVLARDASSAHDAAIYWALAERKFGQFVSGAERTNPTDRYLGAAKVRLAASKVEREKAEKRRAKEPLRRSEEEDLPL